MIILGIDGGGTKTDMAVADATGNFVRRVTGGPSNPSGMKPEAIRETLQALLGDLLIPLGRIAIRVDSCYAGISGCGLDVNARTLHGILSELLPQTPHLACGSDSVNALNCGAGMGNGIAAIAGTGSNIVSRVDGVMRQIGGWGYLLGDEGSGYALGRMALTAALRAHDGRGEPTALSGLCACKLGTPVHLGVPMIYESGQRFIASFGPCIPDAAGQGDRVAIGLMREAAQALAEGIRTAGRDMPKPVKVVLIGSVWANDGMMEKLVTRLLGEDYHLFHPGLPPVYGAVLQAASQAGIRLPDGFEKHFEQCS